MIITKIEKFIEKLNEGLIKTYDIEVLERIISKLLSNKSIIYDIIHTSNNQKISYKIYNPNNDISLELDKITKLNGYFISSYIVELQGGYVNYFKSLDNFKINNSIKSITFVIESKFDHRNLFKDIDKLYHVTREEHLEKILKNGLLTKNGNKKSIHPNRIYLFEDIDDYGFVVASFKRNKIKCDKRNKYYTYVLLEIDNKDLSLKLNEDPNFINFKGGGYYTYDNIHPSKIKVLSINL